MALDYYQILQIPTSADLSEIKAAYRKLAHQYHPDKNPDDKSAKAHFELVKEAYETLSNPVTKERYLQERWLAKANGYELEQLSRTPEQILMLVLVVSKKIQSLDIYRTNMAGIKENIASLINQNSVTILNDFNDLSVNDAIVKEMLQTISILPAKDQLDMLKIFRLINSNFSTDIKNREEELAGKMFWENWKPAFILLMVLLLCLLIWGTSLKG